MSRECDAVPVKQTLDTGYVNHDGLNDLNPIKDAIFDGIQIPSKTTHK